MRDDSLPIAPAGGRFTVGYRNESTSGALLLTDGKITKNKLEPEQKIKEWMTREREEAMMKMYPVTQGKWNLDSDKDVHCREAYNSRAPVQGNQSHFWCKC